MAPSSSLPRSVVSSNSRALSPNSCLSHSTESSLILLHHKRIRFEFRAVLKIHRDPRSLGTDPNTGRGNSIAGGAQTGIIETEETAATVPEN